MVGGGPESWNLRDHHMVETLKHLMDHYGDGAKAVVWEHNTHIGDARWTDMAEVGMVNVGQLVREEHPADDVVLIGFGSHRDSVTASDWWGGATRSMPLPPAEPSSVEALLHEELDELRSSLFIFTGDAPDWTSTYRPHRGVGVVYQPGMEHLGNYTLTVLASRYDAFLWFDTTSALTPLHGTHPDLAEPETWPSGR
jgi:erythromycin esterase